MSQIKEKYNLDLTIVALIVDNTLGGIVFLLIFGIAYEPFSAIPLFAWVYFLVIIDIVSYILLVVVIKQSQPRVIIAFLNFIIALFVLSAILGYTPFYPLPSTVFVPALVLLIALDIFDIFFLFLYTTNPQQFKGSIIPKTTRARSSAKPTKKARDPARPTKKT